MLTIQGVLWYSGPCNTTAYLQKEVSIVKVKHSSNAQPYLLILWAHSSVKATGMRYDVSFVVELADFEAIVAKLGKPIPVITLVLQQEDRELARRSTALRVWVLDCEPPNHLPLHHQG